MRVRQYFSLSLWLPVVVVGVGAVTGFAKSLATIVVYSMPVYIPIALWTWRRIRRAQSMGDLIVITLSAPLAFCGVLTVAATLLTGSFGLAFGYTTAVVSFVGSYTFVLLIWALYLALRAMNLVVRDIAA